MNTVIGKTADGSSIRSIRGESTFSVGDSQFYATTPLSAQGKQVCFTSADRGEEVIRFDCETEAAAVCVADTFNCRAKIAIRRNENRLWSMVADRSGAFVGQGEKDSHTLTVCVGTKRHTEIFLKQATNLTLVGKTDDAVLLGSTNGISIVDSGTGTVVRNWEDFSGNNVARSTISDRGLTIQIEPFIKGGMIDPNQPSFVPFPARYLSEHTVTVSNEVWVSARSSDLQVFHANTPGEVVRTPEHVKMHSVITFDVTPDLQYALVVTSKVVTVFSMQRCTKWVDLLLTFPPSSVSSAKFVMDSRSGKLLGVHITAPDAWALYHVPLPLEVPAKHVTQMPLRSTSSGHETVVRVVRPLDALLNDQLAALLLTEGAVQPFSVSWAPTEDDDYEYEDADDEDEYGNE